MKMIKTYLQIAVFCFLGSGVVFAQPKDGDILISFQYGASAHSVAYLDPASSVYGTLFMPLSGIDLYGQILMARDNIHVLVSSISRNSPTGENKILRVDPYGGVSTLYSLYVDSMASLSLDYDGMFIAAATGYRTQKDYLFGLNSAGLVSTFSSNGIGNQSGNIERVVIDRDQGQGVYVLARNNQTTLDTGWLYRADRNGLCVTISKSTLNSKTDIVNDDNYDGFIAVKDGLVLKVKENGEYRKYTTISSYARSVTRSCDSKIWIGAIDHGTYVKPILYCADKYGVIIYTKVFDKLGFASINSIEVYGSRRVVCTGDGKPGSRVRVDLKSAKPEDKNKPYVMACSFARRPGIHVGSAGIIALQPDSLFFLATSNKANNIFEKFQGNTDTKGAAISYINVPANLPANTGITIFVAGAIYDNKGIGTVTNTHWFVLN
jgi:hypothetical protein